MTPEMFFSLYYVDGWRSIYTQHREEIGAEWKRRHWTRQQKRFVMTPYGERGFVLEHDLRREYEMKLWHEWRAREGWKTETFPQYLERMQKRGDLDERK